MASLTIHNLDDNIKKHLQINARNHNCSIEDEVKLLLKQVFFPAKIQKKLGSRLHQQIIELTNGVELELPERSLPRSAPNFSENS